MKSIDPPNKRRILVVDDHPFFREGLCQWIDRQPDLFCGGCVDSAEAARQAVAAHRPDLVLLDLRLRDSDGLDILASLVATYPGLQILVLSQLDEKLFAAHALRAGARGYVMKEEATEVVGQAIHTVLGGAVHVSPRLSARFMGSLFGQAGPQSEPMQTLSTRELEVFQMLGQAMSTKAIAGSLNLSVKTVETYRENLKRKLGLPDSPSLIRAAAIWVAEGRFPPVP